MKIPIILKNFATWASRKGISLPRELTSKNSDTNEATESESSLLTTTEAIERLFGLDVVKIRKDIEIDQARVEARVKIKVNDSETPEDEFILKPSDRNFRRDCRFVQDFEDMAQSNFLGNLTLSDWRCFAEWGAFSTEQRQMCTFGEPDEFSEFRLENDIYKWVPIARKKASEILAVARKEHPSNGCPKQSDVATEVAKYLADMKIQSAKDKPIDADYVRKEALSANSWWTNVVMELNFPRKKSRKVSQ